MHHSHIIPIRENNLADVNARKGSCFLSLHAEIQIDGVVIHIPHVLFE